MEDFDNDMPFEAVQKQYARAIYMLRETRKALLQQHGVDDEAALLDKIRSGETGEHPAYDHYLGMLIVEQARMQLRAELMAEMGHVTEEVVAPSIHLMLKERIEADYAQQLTEPVRMAQDALLLSFDTGLLMEVRYANAAEYALSWSWGEADFRIDTAPAHPQCDTAPNHLHRDDGTVGADPFTTPGADCWSNLSRLLEALLANPLLE